MEQSQEFTIRKPVRRRRTGMEVFKEAYLPYLILLLAAIIIVVFILGALARKNQTSQLPETTQTMSTGAVAKLAFYNSPNEIRPADE